MLVGVFDVFEDVFVQFVDVVVLLFVIFLCCLVFGFYDIIMGCYGVVGVILCIGQEVIQMQMIVSFVLVGMGVVLVL